jgi:hypothetical protein
LIFKTPPNTDGSEDTENTEKPQGKIGASEGCPSGQAVKTCPDGSKNGPTLRQYVLVYCGGVAAAEDGEGEESAEAELELEIDVGRLLPLFNRICFSERRIRNALSSIRVPLS